MGRAVAESGIPRKDIFITTKVADGDQVYDSTLHAFESSMDKLQLNYLVYTRFIGLSRVVPRYLESARASVQTKESEC